MILGFKTIFPWGKPTNFPEKILAVIKIHTMREDLNDRWNPGRAIQFAIGQRTKNYHQFAEGVCSETLRLELNPESRKVINADKNLYYGDRRELASIEIDNLARNDGFDSTEDFWRWFNKSIRVKLIFWKLGEEE